MNIFGIHFCQDEAYALLMGVAFLGPAVAWLRGKIWAVRRWRAGRKAQSYRF